MKSVILLLVIVSTIVIVESTSNAVGVSICDAYFPYYGCYKWKTSGSTVDRLTCLDNETKTMYWTAAPVRSDDYLLVAGSEIEPATSYYPGELIDVHIRVMTYGMVYRGILLYAVDSNGDKVGDWIAPQDEDPLFWNPYAETPGHTCNNAMMHTTATWKPYHSVFQFKTPSAGTGKITFHCLIKQGDANTGSFFWPNKKGDVSLNEDKPRDQVWYKSALGESCQTTCQKLGKPCDSAAMAKINSQDILDLNILNRYTCNLPILSGCSSLGPTSGSDGYCYYYDTKCDNQTRPNIGSVSCTSSSQDSKVGYRFCACGENVDVNTNIPGEETESGSTKNHLFLSLLFFCIFMLTPKKNQPLLFLFALIFLIGSLNGISAHNWINTPSRSPQANTFAPCLPQRNEKPHIQVGPNQEFQIEWMTGHESRKTYFVILHEKDADKMKLHNDKLLDDYFKNAPNNSNVVFQAIYQKYHRKNNNNTEGFFNSLVSSAQSFFLERPSSFTGRYSGPGYLFSYNTSQMANDFRVSYKSEKYPWIESVYRFEHARHMPSEFDVARFIIPGRSGYGRYVVHYVWAGYRDCIDVDYMDHQITNIYGVQTGPDVWTRIDHCAFVEPTSIRTKCVEVVTNPDWCISTCTTQNINSCSGVNVQRLKHPSTVYKKFRNVNVTIPWYHGTCNSTLKDFENAPDDTYICYGVTPRLATDTITEYIVSLDPNDPIFYSTCYVREKNIDFEGYGETGNETKNTNKDSKWRFQDKCITCEDQKKNEVSYQIPKWVLSDTCINCDIEPANLPSLPKVWTQIRNLSVCDGFGDSWSRNQTHTSCPNGTSCVKRLLPRGSPSIKPEDCVALATKDPECSNYIMSRISGAYQCYCYKKLNCCKTCSSIRSSSYEIVELDPAPADPTCANGILSADNTFCCSLSCGVGGCRNSTSYSLNEVGFCQYNQESGYPKRKCSQYGAPCVM